MLLVASPRYSLISRSPGPSPRITTPSPAGPGLPLHAPSVQTWIAFSGTLVARAEDLPEDVADGLPASREAWGRASAGSPASNSASSLPGAGVRLREPARYTRAPGAGL